MFPDRGATERQSAKKKTGVRPCGTREMAAVTFKIFPVFEDLPCARTPGGYIYILAMSGEVGYSPTP